MKRLFLKVVKRANTQSCKPAVNVIEPFACKMVRNVPKPVRRVALQSLKEVFRLGAKRPEFRYNAVLFFLFRKLLVFFKQIVFFDLENFVKFDFNLNLK